MYEQQDATVPRKPQAGYRDGGNWGTAKTRNIRRVVYSLKGGGLHSGTYNTRYTES